MTSGSPLGEVSRPDYVPSANKPIWDASPDRLAVVARLFGLDAAPPERCRVLEIGCAEGAHLVPLALLDPESRYVGIDLDSRAVEKGNQTIATLGLDNVKLECGDFRELVGRTERFDYVVAHGMYSWLPGDVRDALLSTLASVLDEHGLAHLSFNTLPGSFARSIVRELLLPQVRELGEPYARIARAREIVKELLQQPPANPQFALLRAELEHFSRVSDSLVHHDYLAETNESFFVGEFARHLERHGLEYVTDASILDRSPFGEHPLVARLDGHFDHPAERLEYVDRLEMRRFRQAAVRRKGAPTGPLDFARAETLWFASSAEPSAPGAVRGTDTVRFKTVTGMQVATNAPDLKLALYELGRVWPQALRLDDLATRVGEHLGSAPNAAGLSKNLLDSGASAAVRAFARPPRSLHAPSKKPEATALARLEATRGGDVTNLHHIPVTVQQAFQRKLLTLLDGTRDRDELSRALTDAVEAREVAIPGVEPGAKATWEGLIPREVEAGLERLARFALLIG